MTMKHEDDAKRGRRQALKAIVAGAGGLSALPILGQAQPARAAQPESAATAAEISTVPRSTPPVTSEGSTCRTTGDSRRDIAFI